MPPSYPFTAVVGSEDMALALLLTAVSPEVGGVLVRGEKGTAKSTMVRALTEILPAQQVVPDCRFGCDPDRPDPTCPDGPHDGLTQSTRPAQLVELPVGATEDRVTGSLDLEQALGAGVATFSPGLLATANRGILYVDEVNLLHDHLVDLLLDAAAMGRSTVERDGVSVTHAARVVLVGTMNPEEGELRPQLLDRFGLTVEVAAPRDPGKRAEVVRRRLAFDGDPAGFAERYAKPQQDLVQRLAEARDRLGRLQLDDWALTKIATVCAGFEVDGMRADIVTARAALAHAAWEGHTRVRREDIRAAARLALPHRRRRNPFDAPGLDEELLDRLLGDDDPEPDPTDPDTDGPDTHDHDTDPELQDPGPGDPDPGDEPDQASDNNPEGPANVRDAAANDGASTPDSRAEQHPGDPSDSPSETGESSGDEGTPGDAGATPIGVTEAGDPYRARVFTARNIGRGASGRRSRAYTERGRTIGAHSGPAGPVHLPETIRAAAPRQAGRGRTGRMLVERDDLRRARREGREANLLLFCVDASGSMAARRRMTAVKSAVLSLLMDAYQRRDRIGLVTFRGDGAEVTLPPTSSVEVAARRLTDLPHGGRTPLAEGLWLASETLRLERIRDPRRRPLLIVLTDGRATFGNEPLPRALRTADHLRERGIDAVVIDCETGRFRLGLAGRLARRLGAEHLPLEEVSADGILAAVGRRDAA